MTARSGGANDGTRREWHRLSKREAREIYDGVVAGHPERARAAAAELDAIGAADFSIASLERLWPVVVERYKALPVGGDVADMSDCPVWVEFRPTIAAEMGPARVRLAAVVGSYLAETALRSHPLVCWTIADVKSQADFGKTVVEFGPDGARLDPDGLVGATLEQATAEDDPHKLRPQRRQPDALRTRLESQSSTSHDAVVSLVEHLGDRYMFTVLDEVDHASSDRIDQVLVGLAAADGIDAVDRTDREVFEVRTRLLDASAVHAAVQTAFRRALHRSGVPAARAGVGRRGFVNCCVALRLPI